MRYPEISNEVKTIVKQEESSFKPVAEDTIVQLKRSPRASQKQRDSVIFKTCDIKYLSMAVLSTYSLTNDEV